MRKVNRKASKVSKVKARGLNGKVVRHIFSATRESIPIKSLPAEMLPEGSKEWFQALDIAEHKKHAKTLSKDGKAYLTQANKHLAMIVKLKAQEARSKLKAKLAKRKV